MKITRPSTRKIWVGSWSIIASTRSAAIRVLRTWLRGSFPANRDEEAPVPGLNPELAETHLSLAVALGGAYDWPKAQIEFDRAIELSPNLG